MTVLAPTGRGPLRRGRLERQTAEEYTPDDFMQMDKTFQCIIDLTSDEAALWSRGWCATNSFRKALDATGG